MVADFWDAFEEAERVRSFGIAGLYELQPALERAEADLGVSRDTKPSTEPRFPGFRLDEASICHL
jgi:hypothetical protein